MTPITPTLRDSTPLQTSLLGASMVHDRSKSYGQEIVPLLNRVWPVLKARSIPNRGKSWIIYDQCDSLFGGVETADPAVTAPGLERREILIPQYAEWNHVGPYSRLGDCCKALNAALKSQGLTPGWPLIEIYGHWDPDESKLETLIVMPYSK